MKKFTLILLFASLLCSCRKENVTDGCGWLCIEDICVSGYSAMNTKGTVDNDLCVSIFDGGGKLLQEYAAGTIPSKIALPSGNYTLSACSPDVSNWQQSNGGAGSAAYRCDEAFVIEPEMYSYVKLVATMVNYGICFAVDDGLEQWFKYFSLSVDGSGGRSLSLMKDTVGWFDDEKINVTLNATNTDGDNFKGTSYTLVPEKGHRYTFRYTLSPSTSDKDATSLSITIDDEFEDSGYENIEINN